MKKLTFLTIFFFELTLSLTAQTTAAEWLNKANEYYDKGDYANAITAYSESINRGTNFAANAYYLRCHSYAQIKNYDAATTDFGVVEFLALDFPTVYVSRGYVYCKKGEYHRAVAEYKAGLEKGYDPNGLRVNKSDNADMWFCGAIYMNIVINRFLGNTAA